MGTVSLNRPEFILVAFVILFVYFRFVCLVQGLDHSFIHPQPVQEEHGQ